MEYDQTHQEGDDPASKAFAEVRREVRFLRMGMENMADVQARIEIPDYTATLREMSAQIQNMSEGMNDLVEQPALAVSPQSLAQQIAAAGDAATQRQQATFEQATTNVEHASTTVVTLGREMEAMLKSARQAKEQKFWMKCGIAGGAIIGAVLMAALPGPIARSMPESWLWPEQRAGQALGMDGWQAGLRLLQVADPKRWQAHAIFENATKESRDDLAACLAKAKKRGKPVSCTLMVQPLTAMESAARK